MAYTVKLYSRFDNEVDRFLKLYFNKDFIVENKHCWKHEVANPVELVDIATTFCDNKEKFKANMWISLDKDVYISISDNNIEQIVRYIFERFPY